MGLDVGVFTINYLPRPSGRAYDFAWELAHAAALNCGGNGNSFWWLERRQIHTLMTQWARTAGLTPSEQEDVWAWIASLPWDGDHIYLHFNW